MQGIYTYIPETNYVPREYSVAAILLLLFMVLISLVSLFNLLLFIIIIIIIDITFLQYYAVSTGNNLPKFRRMVPSKRR